MVPRVRFGAEAVARIKSLADIQARISGTGIHRKGMSWDTISYMGTRGMQGRTMIRLLTAFY